MQERAIGFAHYQSELLGAALDYPEDLTKSSPLAGREGKWFRSADGRTQLIVNETPHMENKFRERLYAGAVEANAERRVTMQSKGSDFYVLAGTLKGQVVHEKTIFADGIMAQYQLVFDPALSSRYQPMMSHMEESFRFTR